MSKARATFFRGLCSLLSLKQSRLTTLIYHQVLAKPDPLRPWEIDRIRFEQQMRWITEAFRVIPLAEAVQKLKNDTLEKGCVCITFDDGYRNNATVALEVLKAFDCHATFFCTSAYLEGGMMWNDKIIEAIRAWPQPQLDIPSLEITALPVSDDTEKLTAIFKTLGHLKYAALEKRTEIANNLLQHSGAAPRQQMMSAKDIMRIKQEGMDIGGHTHEHPILLKMETAQAKHQILHNKRLLEELIDEPLRLFAYPNGIPDRDYDKRHIQILKNAGYEAAMSTSAGAAQHASDLFQLPRFTPWDRTPSRFLTRLAVNTLTPVAVTNK